MFAWTGKITIVLGGPGKGASAEENPLPDLILNPNLISPLQVSDGVMSGGSEVDLNY